jgi:hypothetical protein
VKQWLREEGTMPEMDPGLSANLIWFLVLLAIAVYVRASLGRR